MAVDSSKADHAMYVIFLSKATAATVMDAIAGFISSQARKLLLVVLNGLPSSLEAMDSDLIQKILKMIKHSNNTYEHSGSVSAVKICLTLMTE